MNTVKTKEPKTIVQKTNTTDKTILSIIRNENKELKEENSNKNTMLASTPVSYTHLDVYKRQHIFQFSIFYFCNFLPRY